jgi:BASS family bile acid:Na+ symporter
METLASLFNLFVALFVIATMLSMGLGLRVSQIVKPLKNPKLIADVLVTNFLLVPLAVLIIISFIPVDEGTKIALIILALAAGAPFTPKLVEIAKGDIALATAVMLLQMVVTVAILPFALPLMLGGDISVDSMEIAKSLVILMIIPLVLALWIKAKFEAVAAVWQERMVKFSNISLLVIIVLMSILNGKDIVAVFGYDMVALILFMLASLAIGYVAGGKLYDNKVVSSLSAGQRNVSAALVVAAQNFEDPKVTIVIIAVSIVGLFILLFAAKKFKK